MLLLCRKHAGSLLPTDDAGGRAFAKIAEGDVVTVDVKRVRNVRHHRLFFALLQIVFTNQSRFHSMDELLDVVKISVGHCRTLRFRDGTECKIPKSISFANMDEDGFRNFYDRVADFVCREVVPRLDHEALKLEVLEMVGGQ